MYKGPEISRFWLYASLGALILLTLEYALMWQHGITQRDYWWYIPESIFLFLLLLRAAVAVASWRRKLPGCDCMQAEALYRIGSNVGSDGAPPHVISRLPRWIGKASGVFCFVIIIVVLAMKATGRATNAVRMELLVQLGFHAALLYFLQDSCIVCRFYYSCLNMQVSRLQFMAYQMERDVQGLEDVVIEPRPPVDVAAYRMAATEALVSASSGECSICTDRIELDTDVAMLPCRHVFHDQCIALWLGQTPSCPICRMAVSLPTRA